MLKYLKDCEVGDLYCFEKENSQSRFYKDKRLILKKEKFNSNIKMTIYFVDINIIQDIMLHENYHYHLEVKVLSE